MADKYFKLYCDQCQALAVNGTATHESGCPNSKQRWITRTRGLTQPVMFPEDVVLPDYLKKKP